MKTAIIIITICSSILLIASVLLQESKSDGLSGVIGGGAEQLFGKKRSNAYDTMLHKITVISSVILLCASCAGIIVLG